MFYFEEEEIPLKPDFGCHVTMNPGYAGRTELPDNLKVLFRPVAMMIPDYGLIAEIMLYAEGFISASILAKKMVKLYSLSSEQLSKQDHYDFGMRAVKSVLVMAGALKRANAGMVEDAVLIRAMKESNVPKFLKDDLPLFHAIVQDLFPTVEIQEPDHGALMEQIKRSLRHKTFGLQNDVSAFNLKIVQLFETFNVRFGVMLVGPTGGGKTVCYRVLQHVMGELRDREKHKGEKANRLYQHVSTNIVNPKSISMGELYGYVDLVSQEWFDGLASKFMRADANEDSEDKRWTIFDGPVDALWIENMNTVLDDNMTLCLSNGQRIKLRPQMRMLFEVQDLAVASPATVSRCGMVYLTPEELGWRPFVKSWIASFLPDETVLSQDLKDYMWDTFEATVDVALEKIRSAFNEPMKTDNLQQVKSLCKMLEVFLKPERGFKGDEKVKKRDFDFIFAFSFTWALGGSLDERSKEFFDTLTKDLFKGVNYPNTGTSCSVFDFYYDLKKDKSFKAWQTKVEPFEFSKEKSYFELMVPTAETYKHRTFLQDLLGVGKHVYFTGATGVGKSVVIQNALTAMSEIDTQVAVINFSAQTSSILT